MSTGGVSLPEIDATTGGFVVNNGHVWIVSPGDNTLTELSVALGGNRIALST